MSDDPASKIIESAARDQPDVYDDAAEERHQRRMRAMRALGDAERDGARIYIFGIWAVVIIVAAVLIMALSASRAHAKDFPVWPPSQCTNGWVDAMTGMCPPRKKASSYIYCAPAIASLSSLECFRIRRKGS
jgi:hypothetical protein